MNLLEFSELLRAQKQKGLTQKQICKKRGLPYSTYQYWKRKANGHVDPKKNFVEVSLPKDIQSPMEITFPNKVSIRLPENFILNHEFLNTLKGL